MRALFTLVAREAPRVDTPEDGYGDEVRRAFSVALDTMAGSVACFGDLIAAEVDGREEEHTTRWVRASTRCASRAPSWPS